MCFFMDWFCRRKILNEYELVLACEFVLYELIRYFYFILYFFKDVL